MGELAEDWRAFNDAKKEHRNKVEPSRVEYATDALMKIGCTVSWQDTEKVLLFTYGDIKGRIYPFTGWYSAKGIGSGRGIHKLVRKLEEQAR